MSDPDYQLRLCPRGVPTEDHGVYAAPRIPQIDEAIVAPDGSRFYVTEVDYDYGAGFDQPPHVLVIARWKRKGEPA